MVVKGDQQRIRALIKDTLTLLCKNGLNFESQFCMEALIVFTLDDEDVFHVSINETVKNALAAEAHDSNGATGRPHASEEGDDSSAFADLSHSPSSASRGGRAAPSRKRPRSTATTPKTEPEDPGELSHEGLGPAGEGRGGWGRHSDAAALPQSMMSLSGAEESNSQSFTSTGEPLPKRSLSQWDADDGNEEDDGGEDDDDDDDGKDIIVIKEELEEDWGVGSDPHGGRGQDHGGGAMPGLAPYGDNDLAQALASGSLPHRTSGGHEGWMDMSHQLPRGGGGAGGGPRSATVTSAAGDPGMLDPQQSDPSGVLAVGEAAWLENLGRSAASHLYGDDAGAGAERLGGPQQAKQYECSICHVARFSTKASMLRHENIHRGRFPYRCPECGKGFQSSTNLQGHMYKHTAVKDHVCPACGKAYAYGKDPRNHIRRAHGELPPLPPPPPPLGEEGPGGLAMYGLAAPGPAPANVSASPQETLHQALIDPRFSVS